MKLAVPEGLPPQGLFPWLWRLTECHSGSRLLFLSVSLSRLLRFFEQVGHAQQGLGHFNNHRQQTKYVTPHGVFAAVPVDCYAHHGRNGHNHEHGVEHVAQEQVAACPAPFGLPFRVFEAFQYVVVVVLHV